jgi:hypothetical protein
MTSANRPGYQKRKTHSVPRAIFLAILSVLIGLIASCANLARVSDQSIPKLVTPLVETDFKSLVEQLQPLIKLQALRSSRLLIQFVDAESAKKYYDADGILVLQRPDKIRLVVQAPVTGTRITEMVSEANRFKVAIYYRDYRRFLIGTNNADYSHWREKLGREGQSALIAARPFHFTEALMVRPLHLGEPGFIYGFEEAIVEEADLRPGAKRNARLLRSFYVISELELSSENSQPARVRRRFWFDRTDQARLARQQIFDNRGILTTEVRYSNYQRLLAESSQWWPGVIIVTRPYDHYSARLTFTEGKFEVDPELPASAFVLENKEGLPETDLDKPEAE